MRSLGALWRDGEWFCKMFKTHVVKSDNCIEIVNKSFRVLLLYPIAFSIITRKFVFDWNVYRRLWFSLWVL